MEPGFYNMDCMEAMKEFPDGFFDLAIVDPPYGGGYREDNSTTALRGGASNWEQRKRSRFGGLFKKYHIEAAFAAAAQTGTAREGASVPASSESITSARPNPAGGGHRLAA